jgi:hypothetical protein
MKIFKDTLLGRNGKYSRKSLTIFVSFIMTVLVGLFITLSDYFLPNGKIINQYAIMVFFGFAGKTSYDLYLTVKDKMNKISGKND